MRERNRWTQAQFEWMLDAERWSRENPGTRWSLHCTRAAGGRGGGRGEGHGFSYLLESRLASRFTCPQELARNTVKSKAAAYNSGFKFIKIVCTVAVLQCLKYT